MYLPACGGNLEIFEIIDSPRISRFREVGKMQPHIRQIHLFVSKTLALKIELIEPILNMR